MKPQYTNIEFDDAKSIDKLPCECYGCGSVFYVYKKMITYGLKNNKDINKYCSNKCQGFDNEVKITVLCKNCNKSIKRTPKKIKKNKNQFCSHSCATTYNNTHKTKGYRRSKLEIYLENQLTELYPNLEIDFNKTDAIESELDIYIPSLNLAFELNGVFHYEPIYGQEKLYKIQNNDNRKFQACIERGIELCIIDTSQQNYFKEKSSQKYLTIIIKLLNSLLSNKIDMQ